MALAPWINPPNYLQAIQAGAQLGAQLRHQRAQEEQAQNSLRLSFAEQALRQQAQQDAAARHAAELALRNNELLVRRDNNAENLMLKGQLEEGRNMRAADSMAAQNQRKQDELTLRKELGVAGNEIKREAEIGKNERAAGFMALRQSIADDANEIKRESNDIRRDSLEWQQDKWEAEFDAKLKKMGAVLPYDQKVRMQVDLDNAKSTWKDNPLQRARVQANILNHYLPKTEPSQPRQASVLPMPKSKSELKAGVTYQTARGPARWDGDSFVQ